MYKITDQTKREHFFKDAREADELIERLKKEHGPKLRMRGRRLSDDEVKSYNIYPNNSNN